MSVLLRGAMIEYGSGIIGPIPNVVIFQFNPEKMVRTMHIPERPGGVNSRESSQAGEPVVESISLTAEFCAADLLNENKFLARTFGIGPQLAALEKMVLPSSKIAGAIGAALDKIGEALGLSGGGAAAPSQPIPREKFPKILFLWGLTRVVPVTISSMKITELEYDPMLNPTRAEVEIGIEIHPVEGCAEDWLAKGAMEYTTIAKEAQAIANLANTAEQIVELIPL